MGYSRSLTTIHRRETLLAPLMKGDARVVWRTTYEEAPRLAYKIMECLHIARARRLEVPRLAALADQYVVRVEQDQVVAELRTTAGSISRPTDIPGASSPKVLLVVSSSAEVIQAWIDSQPSTEPLAVVSAQLDNEAREELRRFASGVGWELVEHGETLILRLVPGGAGPVEPVSLGNSLG